MNALEVCGLNKKYPAFTLESVSFCVKWGRIAGFLGRNGAGKSTTMKAIAGLVCADSGSVRIFGEERQAGGGLPASVGVLFGGAEFYSRRRLGSVASVFARFYPQWNEARYRRLLGQFSLDERKRVCELSNGMKVKFQLALACSHGAELLVLDEPTSGLDPVSRAEVHSILRAFAHEEGGAVLYSTQIVADLEKCADDVIYIRGGRIVRADEKGAFLRAYAQSDGTMPALEEIFLKEEGVCEGFAL